MSWIFIALASHLFWAFSNIGDKFVVANKVRSPYIYVVWTFLIGILAVFIIPFVDFQIPNINQLLWILLATIFEFGAMIPYVKAAKTEEITRIGILWALVPLIALVMAYFTIGENFSMNQWIAFFMLITGTILASVKFNQKFLKFSKEFWLMVISCFGFAAYATIIRYLTQEINFLNVFIYTHIIGAVLALIILSFKKVWNTNKEEIKNFNFKTILTIISISIIGIIGTLLNVWALSLGKVALVYAMEGFQAIFVFILAIIFSLFTSVNLHEKLDGKNIFLKICALLVNFAGIWVLNL